MSIYIEATTKGESEELFAQDLQAAFAFIQARYNKGARQFFIDTEAS